jgi:hypothetical protein
MRGGTLEEEGNAEGRREAGVDEAYIMDAVGTIN